MTYRHFLGAGALLVFLSITGCTKQAKPKEAADEAPPAERFSQLAQQDDQASSPADTEATHTDLNLGASGTQDILAQKTASYAAELEKLLAQRAAESAAAQAAQTTAPAPAVSGGPTTVPVSAAKPSEVAFVDDPAQLPPVTPPPAVTGPVAQARPVAPTAPASPDQKPTIHQLLDTAPAAANQATKIPTGNEQVLVAPMPAVDVRPQQPAAQPARQEPSPDQSTDALARKLTERIKSDPLDVAAHVDYQLLQLVNDRSVPDLNTIAPLPQEDREIVSAVMDGLSIFRNNLRGGGNALISQKTGPLVEMGERVRNQTTLSIPTLVLCRDVKQFGVYQPFEDARFPFGAKHPVVVYCEVENFASQQVGRGLWETKLKYEVLLYTDSSDASLQVWQQKPAPVIDQSHSRRRDFFIAKLLELPQDLPIGGYLMKVSIVDETANRIAESTVPLQIVAK